MAKNIYTWRRLYGDDDGDGDECLYIYIYIWYSVYIIYIYGKRKTDRVNIRGGENAAEERVYALYAGRSAHDAVAVEVYIYRGGRGRTLRSVGRMHMRARVCVCAYGGGGKGLVSRRGGMKSGYRAEANGIIHPPPPPRHDRRSPPLRVYTVHYYYYVI